MPDGRSIRLSDEVTKCPELLFNPKSLKNLDWKGIQDYCWDALSLCDIDARKDLLGSVVLSGGSTLFPNFAKRLQDEL